METYYDEIDDDILILVVDGGLNKGTAEELATKIEQLVDVGLRKLIVDCSQLNMITSSGLGVLVRIHNRMKAHDGDVKIAGVKSVLAQVLQITKLDSLFEFYPDVNRARLAFRPKG
ncbi:MAG: STAS domain-containing protein [Planctomycetota bacterium]